MIAKLIDRIAEILEILSKMDKRIHNLANRVTELEKQLDDKNATQIQTDQNQATHNIRSLDARHEVLRKD